MGIDGKNRHSERSEESRWPHKNLRDTTEILRCDQNDGFLDFAVLLDLKEQLERLLHEAAEVEVELSRANGTIKIAPHHSLIEGCVRELGKRLSRQVQQRQMSELAWKFIGYGDALFAQGKYAEANDRHRKASRSVQKAAKLFERAGRILGAGHIQAFLPSE